jgi:hypothetical protein
VGGRECLGFSSVLAPSLASPAPCRRSNGVLTPTTLRPSFAWLHHPLPSLRTMITTHHETPVNTGDSASPSSRPQILDEIVSKRIVVVDHQHHNAAGKVTGKPEKQRGKRRPCPGGCPTVGRAVFLPELSTHFASQLLPLISWPSGPRTTNSPPFASGAQGRLSEGGTGHWPVPSGDPPDMEGP